MCWWRGQCIYHMYMEKSIKNTCISSLWNTVQCSIHRAELQGAGDKMSWQHTVIWKLMQALLVRNRCRHVQRNSATSCPLNRCVWFKPFSEKQESCQALSAFAFECGSFGQRPHPGPQEVRMLPCPGWAQSPHVIKIITFLWGKAAE